GIVRRAGQSSLHPVDGKRAPAAAAFDGGVTLVFIDEIVMERAFEVTAQGAALGIQALQEVVLAKLEQQALHGIFGAIRSEPFATRAGVERVPTIGAELLHGGTTKIGTAPGGEDGGPTRFGKLAGPSAGRVRRHPASISLPPAKLHPVTAPFIDARRRCC